MAAMRQPPPARLDVLRATEAFCLTRGVDALSLAEIASALGETRPTVAALFHDETTLLDAILERHQIRYERAWDEALPAIDDARGALDLLVRSVTACVRDEDGGPAYIAITAQMCNSTRFPLTGRPATTTPSALKLMGKLTTFTAVPFTLFPLRFERFAAVLFSSVFSWYRHGPARIDEAIFIEDLIDTLEPMALAPPSPRTQRLLGE